MTCKTLLALSFLGSLCVAGCGGVGNNNSSSGGGGGGSVASVTVACAASPCSVQSNAALTNNTLQLTATVTCTGTCNTGVTWYVNNVVNGNSTVGTINNVGLYTSPTTVPSGGTVTVKAVGSDGVTAGSTTVTITQGPVPVLVAYTNGGVTNATCPGGICSVVYTFNLNNPQGQVQASPFSPYQDVFAAISPDQSLTAYARQLAIYTVPTVPVQGTTPTLIRQWTDTHFALMGLDWKPDGSGFVIADTDPTNGVCGLQTISKDGSSIQSLAATNMSCTAGGSIMNPTGHPRYFSDGRITYSAAGKNGNSQIFVLSSDGKTVTNLSNNGFNDRNSSLSPDGTKIVFESDRNGSPSLYTMNFDGTGTIPLLGTPSIQATWCSGNKIVFEDGATFYLWQINADGTGKAQLNSNTSFEPYCR